jgi:hypothetical protein
VTKLSETEGMLSLDVAPHQHYRFSDLQVIPQHANASPTSSATALDEIKKRWKLIQLSPVLAVHPGVHERSERSACARERERRARLLHTPTKLTALHRWSNVIEQRQALSAQQSVAPLFRVPISGSLLLHDAATMWREEDVFDGIHGEVFLSQRFFCFQRVRSSGLVYCFVCVCVCVYVWVCSRVRGECVKSFDCACARCVCG